MKPLLALGLVLLPAVSAQAQLFRPSAINGALIGATAGAVIGNNSSSLRHDAWRGAAYGAGVGLLIGSALDDAPAAREWHVRSSRGWERHRPQHHGWYGQRRILRHHPHAYPHYGYARWSNRVPYHAPIFRRGVRVDHRVGGIFWGGVGGAIIGHNSGFFGHNAWRGAAYGAGLGYVMGAVSEQRARQAEAVARVQESLAQPSAVAAPPPQQVTIINNYYAPTSTVGSANALFGR